MARAAPRGFTRALGTALRWVFVVSFTAKGRPPTPTPCHPLLQTIMRQEGFRGFFRGAWTNTVRCLPGASIQFGAYEMMKGALGC